MSQDKNTTRNPRAELSVSVALALLALLVYSPTFRYPFVNYDDPAYVFQNPQVQTGLTADNIRWAFTTFACGNWHPLTWLSLQLDAELFGGQNAGAFHVTNVLLHTANTLLLFVVLVRLTQEVGRSAMVAGLFALHPLHVESVAWVAERKDVLSTFFWFLALAAYVYYRKRPSVLRYLPLLLALGFGLLAKPMLVTLPCVLLLLDYWPLHRWSRRAVPYLLLEKVPLFVLVLCSCIVTIYAQYHGQAVAPVEELPLTARVGNALLSYASYLGQMLWPADLAVYYPLAGAGLSVARVTAAGLLLASITVLVLGSGRGRPYLAVGWLWYLGTLVPVIGLVQVGSQGMADRYTYVPSIGVFLMLTWGAADLATVWRLRRPYLVAAAVVVLSACALRTWNQVGCWQSTRHLWECAVRATTNNALAHTNLGVCYMEEGRFTEAKREFETAAALDPHRADPRIGLGNVFYHLGLWGQAAAEFRTAIDLAPQWAGPHYNLGNALAQLGQREQAIAEYRRAIDLNPDDPGPHIGLGGQLAAMNRHEEALAECRLALSLDPNNPHFHSQFAEILQKSGRLEEALAEYRKALELGDEEARPRLQACERLLEKRK